MRPLEIITCLLGLGLLAAADPASSPEDVGPIFVCPLPKCGKCPSKQRATAPGVGFALGIGYGTVSINYNNGTFIPVAQIKGTPEYTALMQHLATSPIERMYDGSRPPPGVDESESDYSTLPLWVRFYIRRLLKKLIWQPATPEIGVLAEMVSKLRREAEVRLGRSIKGAALASPDRVRLTSQEITVIFDYLWMKDLVRDKHDVLFNKLFSMVAAMAGYRAGLCDNYTNEYECAKEEHFSPYRRILQLDYSNYSLSAAMERSNTARSIASHNTFVDLTLGSDHQPKDFGSDNEYWNGLETRIRKFVGSHRPDELLLTGESASEPHFIQIVKDVMSSPALPMPNTSNLRGTTSEQSEQFLFATSMGAAEFAKRRQEGMARCWLPKACRGEKSVEGVVENNKEL